MINLGQFFGEKLPELKRIGNINKQNETYGDSMYATMGASILAEKLSKKYPALFEKFCKGRQITTEEATKRIAEESDQDFIAKILPALLLEIPIDKTSERIYITLLDELDIPEKYKDEALKVLQKVGPIQLDTIFN